MAEDCIKYLCPELLNISLNAVNNIYKFLVNKTVTWGFQSIKGESIHARN